jgi:hypothetical protein
MLCPYAKATEIASKQRAYIEEFLAQFKSGSESK